ncbi:MAG: hypothetical protein KKA07_06710 [Bacteroidetes bacterium]|nr:hypothetical protein [Bacteroidota bacterium]
MAVFSGKNAQVGLKDQSIGLQSPINVFLRRTNIKWDGTAYGQRVASKRFSILFFRRRGAFFSDHPLFSFGVCPADFQKTQKNKPVTRCPGKHYNCSEINQMFRVIF